MDKYTDQGVNNIPILQRFLIQPFYNPSYRIKKIVLQDDHKKKLSQNVTNDEEDDYDDDSDDENDLDTLLEPLEFDEGGLNFEREENDPKPPSLPEPEYKSFVDPLIGRL